MGYISSLAFSLDFGAGHPSCDHVQEEPGYTGEWVTTVALDAYGQPIKFKRRGRTVYATKKEAIAESKRRVANKEMAY